MFAYQLDPTLYAAHMYRTTVCKSVSLGKKCNHQKCAFAHTRAELRPNRCPYDQTCRGCNRYHSHQNLDAFLDAVCKDVKWPSFETETKEKNDEKNDKNETPSNAYTVPCNGKCGLQTCFFAHDQNQLRVVPCRNENDHDHSECQYFHQTDTKSSYIARRKFVFPSTSFVIRIDDSDEDDDEDDENHYVSLSISKISMTIPSA